MCQDIDILAEPLDDGSVRFAFQITTALTDSVPTWAANFIVQKGMANIFAKLKETASLMHAKDPSSEHYAFVQRPAYQPTKRNIEDTLNVSKRT